MLLESHVNDRTILVFDAESVGGIDKGALTVKGHPDKVLSSAVTAIRSIAQTVGEAAVFDAVTPPTGMEVTFAVKVDSNAVVSIARNPGEGQLQVTLRWQLGPTGG